MTAPDPVAVFRTGVRGVRLVPRESRGPQRTFDVHSSAKLTGNLRNWVVLAASKPIRRILQNCTDGKFATLGGVRGLKIYSTYIAVLYRRKMCDGGWGCGPQNLFDYIAVLQTENLRHWVGLRGLKIYSTYIAVLYRRKMCDIRWGCGASKSIRRILQYCTDGKFATLGGAAGPQNSIRRIAVLYQRKICDIGWGVRASKSIRRILQYSLNGKWRH
ncbi:hypothetical protein AVEN_72421-1 [Araneus ventricosus]|uniref:Uncharacterized protein n=1 Tax=Araneus ventricosus TaxID=182803 RepID=A0A4Y2SRA2_ARAVE|nr:hypothetical protein AVEN_72421-1 [Araneus ventricosus]